MLACSLACLLAKVASENQAVSVVLRTVEGGEKSEGTLCDTY